MKAIEQIEIKMNLRPAEKDDLINHFNQLKQGQIYFIRSGVKNAFDPIPYYISDTTDRKELARMNMYNQIYVPIGYFDDPNIKVTNTQLQTQS